MALASPVDSLLSMHPHFLFRWVPFFTLPDTRYILVVTARTSLSLCARFALLLR